MKRVYWTKAQAAIIAVGITLVSLVGLAPVLGYPGATIWTRMFGFVLFGAVMWFFIIRVAFARLYALPDGVRIVNPLRTVFLPWDRIDRFSLRPWRLVWTPIGVADLRDGTSVPIIGIAAPNPAHWPRHQRSAEHAIAELNELLKVAHSGSPFDSLSNDEPRPRGAHGQDTERKVSAAQAAVWDLFGGAMTWKAREYNHVHPVDPYLFELGWRAWLWLVEEMNDSSALTAPEFAALLAQSNENDVVS